MRICLIHPNYHSGGAEIAGNWPPAWVAYIAGETAGERSATSSQKDDPKRDPKHDPINVPDSIELNQRQHWFLARIEEGRRCGAKEIATAWEVSPKTARRDIRGLREAQLLEYVGSRRKGKYQRILR